MPTKAEKLTVTDLKAFARDRANKTLAIELRILQAKAKKMRQEVDAIYQPIFEKYTFVKRDGTPITYEEDHLYMCDDEALVAQYFEEIDVAIHAHGYDVPKNSCPALRAEHEIIKHEWKLIDAMTALLGVERPGDLHLIDEMVKMFLKIVEGK